MVIEGAAVSTACTDWIATVLLLLFRSCATFAATSTVMFPLDALDHLARLVLAERCAAESDVQHVRVNAAEPEHHHWPEHRSADYAEDRLDSALNHAALMYDSRLRLSKQFVEEVRRYFGDKVFKSVVARNVRSSEAPSFGKPIILYDAISIGTRNYMELAQELLAQNDHQIVTT